MQNGETTVSDNKKYYYLKLKENFFDSDEMILLETSRNGYKYSNILLKLYLKSLKNDGKLMLNERIPYNVPMLSKITRHAEKDIEKALKQFTDLGLIEMLDNGAIFMSDIQNFVGTSSSEADRVRAYRKRIDKEASIQKGVQKSVQMYDERTPELEIEQELDLEKETEIKQEQQQKIEQELDIESDQDIEIRERFADAVDSSFNLDDCLAYYVNEFDSIGSIERNTLDRLGKRYGFDFLYEAMTKTAFREDVKSPLAYITALLKEWQEKGFTTVDDIQDEQEAFNEQLSQSDEVKYSVDDDEDKLPF